MSLHPSTVSSTPCRRCHRRCQLSHRERLCQRCELEYHERKSSLPLSLWKVLGFLFIVPLIAVTWNASSPLGAGMPGLVLGNAWLLLLGLFAGEYLSRKLVEARLLLFRYRFEQEERSTSCLPPTKGLYEI